MSNTQNIVSEVTIKVLEGHADWKPGQLVIAKFLALEFGVSSNTASHALRALVASGLLVDLSAGYKGPKHYEVA